MLALASGVAATQVRPALAEPSAVVNPVRTVDPTDVYRDPAHGFIVLVEQDATLRENEVEGPVAIGGNLSFRDFRAGSNHPGAYVLPGDAQPTSLVVGGRLDYAASTPTARFDLLNASYAKFGDLSNATAVENVSTTDIVPAGRPAPVLQVHTPQPAASLTRPSGFDLPTLFTTYRKLNAGMAACPSTAVLRDQNGQNPWNGEDPTATLGLRPGQNTLTLTPDQLDKLATLNPLAGYNQPGDGSGAWLIVNVPFTGDRALHLPNVTWQGNSASRHVLWNFTTTGTLTLPPETGTLWGTLYAPNAHVLDVSPGNVEGDLIARTLTMGGPDSGSGGEVHHAPFQEVVTTCATADPPSTTTDAPDTTDLPVSSTTDLATTTDAPTTDAPTTTDTPVTDLPTTTDAPVTSTTDTPAPQPPTTGQPPAEPAPTTTTTPLSTPTTAPAPTTAPLTTTEPPPSPTTATTTSPPTTTGPSTTTGQAPTPTTITTTAAPITTPTTTTRHLIPPRTSFKGGLITAPGLIDPVTTDPILTDPPTTDPTTTTPTTRPPTSISDPTPLTTPPPTTTTGRPPANLMGTEDPPTPTTTTAAAEQATAPPTHPLAGTGSPAATLLGLAATLLIAGAALTALDRTRTPKP
ncbi:collagen-binding domain-containing protein [Actinosynnema pretiosum]|uniref:collagen-binding domain-containing protein n=1 Tax=Actinosynnema pretiosum TaxID=42197 RepID=UPI000B208035|nr:collagen-binding domain-containing protein [Actinosynnema pretiosum]